MVPAARDVYKRQIMFSVNPCYDLQPAGENVEELWNEKNYAQPLLNMDAERQSFYETCQRLGVGITVMKAFGGGDLLNAELSPAGRALTVNQCLHYALTRPAVASVLVGAHSVEQLQQCLAYENAGAEEKDYAAALANFPNISWQGHCMYCGHCAPCPQQIDIATVTKFYHLAQAQDNICLLYTSKRHAKIRPLTAPYKQTSILLGNPKEQPVDCSFTHLFLCLCRHLTA